MTLKMSVMGIRKFPQDLGRYLNRKFTILDRYVLDLTVDKEHRLDRRIALALGILLDTGERR